MADKWIHLYKPFRCSVDSRQKKGVGCTDKEFQWTRPYQVGGLYLYMSSKKLCIEELTMPHERGALRA